MSDDSDAMTQVTTPDDDDQNDDDDDDLPSPESKRARKAPRLDQGVRLEKSRQSARECRVRKKLRYQYLEELVQERERAIYALRRDLEKFRGCCRTLDRGELPSELIEKIGRQKLIEIIQTEDPSDENANMSQHMQQQRTMNLHNNGHASSACIAPPPQLSHPRLQMPQQPMTPMHLVQQIPNGSQVTLTAATAAQQAPMSVYNHMNPPMLPGAGPSML